MNKKKKNIVLMILSVFPLKVLIHYFIYTTIINNGLPRAVNGRYAIGKKYYSEWEAPLSFHIDNIFYEEVWLFIPAFVIVLFTGWYFGVFD